MQNNIEFNSFSEAREKDLNLKEIKESIKRLSEAQRRELAHEINNQIIEELHNGMEVKRGDELNFLKALTLEGNTINWTNQREANLIHPGDIIKTEGSNILKNGNIIGNVTGFSIGSDSIEQETQSNSTETTEVAGEQTHDTIDEPQESSAQEDTSEQESTSTQVSNSETNSQTQDSQVDTDSPLDEALDGLGTNELVNQSLERISESKINFLLDNYPDFQGLIEEYPDRIDEWEKRISLSVKLDEALENMGWVNNFMYKGGLEQNINQLKRALYTQTDKSYFNNNKMATRFEGWSRPGSGNMYQLGSQEHSYSELIAMFTNDTSTVSEIFGEINIEAINNLSEQDQEKMGRLETFLSSWERINQQGEFKPSIRRIYDKLNNGELNEAINLSHDFFSNEGNLESTSIHTIINDSSGLVDGLRLIGAQDQASQITIDNISNIEGSDIDREKLDRLNNILESNIQSEREKSMVDAQEKYETILSALEGHPEYYEYSLNRDRIIEGLANTKAQLNLLDNFISQEGSEGLGRIIETYDDMKGLYGLLNFSDNTVKLTKEVAIIAGSMALTMGAGALLTGTATLARAGVLSANANISRARALSSWSKIRTINRSSRLKNAASSANTARLGIQSHGLAGLARLSQAGAKGISYINGVPVFGRAFIFTGSESILRSMSLGEGEINNSLSNFGENFARNAAMFAMFGGVEKIGRPLSNKLVQQLGMRPENFSSVMVGNVILTPGDMAGLYILHSLEKGELEIPEGQDMAEIAAMSLAFRTAIGATNYRRLFNSTNRARGNQSTQQNREQPRGRPAEGSRNNRENNRQANNEGVRNNPNRTSSSRESISRMEKSRFNDLIKNELNKNWSIELKSGTNTMKISKEANGRYSINGSQETLKLKSVLNQIDDRYRIEFLNNHNLNSILKISEGQTIRSIREPIRGKIEIKKGGEVFHNNRRLTIAERNELLINPLVRREILKKGLDQMSAGDILKNIRGKKGFERLKGLGDESLKFGIERFKATYKSMLLGGAIGAGFEVYLMGPEENQEMGEKISRLIYAFAIGATGGLAISVVKTGGLATWGVLRKGGTSIINTGSKVPHKGKLLTVAAIGGGVTYYLYEGENNEEQTTE